VGYGHATVEIDARHFLPQSRPRIFVIGAQGRSNADVQALVDQAALPKRNIDLIDVLDLDSDRRPGEFPPAEVERHLRMMSPAQRARLEEARSTGRPIAGPFARRMRGPKSGEREQRVEVRLDGLANALRVASGGGSSKQFVLIATGAGVRMRPIQPREAARLMGLFDDYVLPSNRLEALSLCGDGVVVPVVQWLAENVLEPLLAGAEYFCHLGAVG
jgi:DNA (cytosine-5)-methyltransferase 1